MPNDECLHVLLVLLEYLFRFAVDLFQRTEIHPLHLFKKERQAHPFPQRFNKNENSNLLFSFRKTSRYIEK